jgi:hypothetical protein
MCVGGHFCFGNEEISLTPKIGHLFELLQALQKLKLKVMTGSIEAKKSTRLRLRNVLRTSLCAKNKFATLKIAPF